MAITPLPPAPTPVDPIEDFNDKAFTWVAALDGFTTQANALAVEVDGYADTATTQAGIATTQAGIATTQAGIATTQAGIATTQAGIATTKAEEAAELTELYQGAHASNPTVDKDGNPLVAGDWYFNTSSNEICVYSGTEWKDALSISAGVTSVNGLQGDVTISMIDTGDIIYTARSLSTPDYLRANGSIYLQNSYSDLFSVIGIVDCADINTWTQKTSSFETTLIYGVAFGNDTFVAVGVNGKLAVSTDDGVTWTQKTSSFETTAIHGVAFGNDTFVAVGDTGKLAVSGNLYDKTTMFRIPQLPSYYSVVPYIKT